MPTALEPHMRVSASQVPKTGAQADQCEDAFKINDSARRLTIAVSDGATESFLARRWAECLASHFASGGAGGFQRLYGESIADWPAVVSAYEQEYAASGGLAWYQLRRLHEASHATLLSVRLTKARCCEGYIAWSAVGDTCLFHVRQNRLLRAVPISAPHVFSHSPDLLNSTGAGAHALGGLRRGRARWRQGDLVILATDALASWCLQSAAEGASPWESLLELVVDGNGCFIEWVVAHRADGSMENDDVTVVVISADE